MTETSETFTVEVPYHIAHAINKVCECLDISPNEYINDCIRAGLGCDARDNFADYAAARMEPLSKMILDTVDP
jgi:hypothetical protein